MSKNYYSLGLMSGTSGDGVDASLINSDGETNYNVEINKYFQYENIFSQKIHSLKEKINNVTDLETFSTELKALEKELTIFHSKVVMDIVKNTKRKIDFVGFHGQTIFHDPSKKISKQIGDGKLLSQLTQTTVVYNFRQNDIQNGGEGAPLAPIFHKALVKQIKIELPVCILNIGGISNVTIIGDYEQNHFTSRDLGPGNCLIDSWVRKNKTLIQRIKSRTLKNLVIQPIDNYGVDGDYVESQAFAFLAIRRFLELPISFPDTTGCKSPTIGGEIVKNF